MVVSAWFGFVGRLVGVGAVARVGGVGFVVFVVTRRIWLDPEHGRLVWEAAGVWRRSVALADASELQIRRSAGQALLQVRGKGRRTSSHLALVAVDMGGDRSQPPEVLRALADQIERWAPERGAVVRMLRAQADHVAAGGAVRESPVALAHLVRGG